MQYFGVPICPYCKKRVNVIRTWSLKKEGEYKCPRCGGISNIYLSPLIYVLAVLAVFAAGAVYCFHKFVLDSVNLSTAIQVIVPFIVFFVLSLFMVYLQKPVIKKVSREELERKKRRKSTMENRRMGAGQPLPETGPVFIENDDYLPADSYGQAPSYHKEEDITIHEPVSRRYEPVSQQNLARTAVMDFSVSQQAYDEYDTSEIGPIPQQEEILPNPTAFERKRTPGPIAPDYESAPTRREMDTPVAAAYEPVETVQENSVGRAVSIPVSTLIPTEKTNTVDTENSSEIFDIIPPQKSRPPRRTSRRETPAKRESVYREAPSETRTVSSVDVPSITDDFFAKYDDPEYINRRLSEMKNGDSEQ